MKKMVYATCLAGLLALGQYGWSQEQEALELARRILGPWGDSNVSVVVEPGRVPAQLPVDLPLPSSFEIVGSFATYQEDGGFGHGQIVLDSPLDSQDTHLLLDETFSSAGWTVQDQPTMHGFQPANPHISGTYCSPQGTAHVYLNAFPLEAGGTDVRLELTSATQYDPCRENEMAHEPIPVPLPTLTAPANSRTSLHGGNWFEAEASSSAIITTDLPADELRLHLARQLDTAGWQRAAPSTDRGGWTKVHGGREWSAFLFIEELAPSSYYVSFVTQVAAEDSVPSDSR